MNNTNPVMFSVSGGINESAGPANNGFDSPGGDSKPTASTYNIPPVIWMLVLLIGGYFGLRWVIED